jgi:hypothetical protein
VHKSHDGALFPAPFAVFLYVSVGEQAMFRNNTTKLPFVDSCVYAVGRDLSLYLSLHKNLKMMCSGMIEHERD